MSDGGRLAGNVDARPFCYRCHKAAVTCICRHVTKIDNRTHIRVVQHPRERFHPIGTARIARLGLSNVQLDVVDPRGGALPASLPDDTVLLYPGPEARDLGGLRPRERPSALVVIDGTWSQARTLFRDHAWLRELPRFGLRPPESRYRLRREPARDCVSSIEAIVEALRILEPETEGLRGLLASFDTMIDDQLAIIAERAAGPRLPRSGAWQRGHAAWVVHEPQRLVVVAGEAAPRDPTDHVSTRRVLQWAAVRAHSGESFEAFVRPPAARIPSECHLAHMDLDARRVSEGGTPEEFRAAWRAFLRPDDVVVSWTQSALTLLGEAAERPSEALQLKSLYCSRNREPCGSLNDVVARLSLCANDKALDLHGRSARSITEMLALLAHLRSAALEQARPKRAGSP